MTPHSRELPNLASSLVKSNAEASLHTPYSNFTACNDVPAESRQSVWGSRERARIALNAERGMRRPLWVCCHIGLLHITLPKNLSEIAGVEDRMATVYPLSLACEARLTGASALAHTYIHSIMGDEPVMRTMECSCLCVRVAKEFDLKSNGFCLACSNHAGDAFFFAFQSAPALCFGDIQSIRSKSSQI